jgi:hypothetical protein
MLAQYVKCSEGLVAHYVLQWHTLRSLFDIFGHKLLNLSIAREVNDRQHLTSFPVHSHLTASIIVPGSDSESLSGYLMRGHHITRCNTIDIDATRDASGTFDLYRIRWLNLMISDTLGARRLVPCKKFLRLITGSLPNRSSIRIED